MALINTGLGWAAEEDFVKQYAGAIGQLAGLDGGTSFPGQPIGAAPSGTGIDVVSNGYMWCETATLEHYYAAANTRDSVYVFVYKSSGRYYYVAVSAVQCAVYRCTRRKSDGVISDPILSAVASGAAPKYYDEHFVSGGAYTDRTILAPRYASRDAGLADLTPVTENVYKLADGYCTGIWARFAFHAVPNVFYVTPVIISSDPDYAEFSLDQISPAGEYHTYTHQGMSFTMGLSLQYRAVSVTNPAFPYRDLSDVTISTLADLFSAAARIVSLTTETSENPYGPYPSSESGGGGTDPTDDEVGVDPVVFPGAIGTGFCRIYSPSLTDLTNLSNYLWGPLFDLDTVKRLFSDPMSSILGLSVVPVTVSGVSAPVSIAGVSTGISLPLLSSGQQHVNADLGSLSVTEKWGAYLDYEPYTKYSIYLPFIGYRTISADDVMGKTVSLTYDIDLLSGACVAKLLCGSSLLYQWAGSCAMQLPVNASNWNSVISAGLAAIGSTATAIASGGSAAPMVAGALASAGTLATQMKPSIERAGGLSGAAAFLSQRRAYMIRTIPTLVNPGNQQHYIGYPSFITKQLGSISGYNIVEDIHLEGIPATQAELEEIDTLLHEGVIL